MAATDTDEQSKPSSLDILESGAYLTELLAMHIFPTQHHLTGATLGLQSHLTRPLSTLQRAAARFTYNPAFA